MDVVDPLTFENTFLSLRISSRSFSAALHTWLPGVECPSVEKMLRRSDLPSSTT